MYVLTETGTFNNVQIFKSLKAAYKKMSDEFFTSSYDKLIVQKQKMEGEINQYSAYHTGETPRYWKITQN